MNGRLDQNHEMGLQDFFIWRSPSAASPAAADEDLPADVDEPPEKRVRRQQPHTDFRKSSVPPQSTRSESLLTQAFHVSPEAGAGAEGEASDLRITTDLTRRRSMLSNASMASTAELTSDGGLTSPARTNTPSPPFPTTIFANLAQYSLASKTAPMPAMTKIVGHTPRPEVRPVSPKDTPAAAGPKKRCISFVCDGKREAASQGARPAEEAAAAAAHKQKPVLAAPSGVEAPTRKSAITFACPGPEAKPVRDEATHATQVTSSAAAPRASSRSPSLPRKSPRPAGQPRSARRESTATLRRASHSPVAVRIKPRYIIADALSIHESEATRFHEFASEEVQEDDWIRKDAEVIRAKLTIHDTLKKENAIRQLGTEAEEEALADEEEIEEEEAEEANEESDDDEEREEDDADQESLDGSDDDASDGNESDNEAGFADSDDSDAEGEFSFWTPGRTGPGPGATAHLVYRPSAHRAASTSSIDSLRHMDPEAGARGHKRRPIKIRPGTPDLPDSTDFVCGTLDEDRPLEDAYVSCMEVRKNARHRLTPQDIDPSFPTSDPEDEEDENDVADAAQDSDEQFWLHGTFEESDDERPGRRRATTARRTSPGRSPRRLHSPPAKQRLHSPPPPKQRLRSPPPRKLFGHSPKRRRSPPPSHALSSPAASPTLARRPGAVAFAPLGSRPGLTHTKSLPRTPNAFCRQYRASRLVAANGNTTDGPDRNTAHVRGAIDIVKGLEEKRQRRKEKFHSKQCNRKSKTHAERRPQPGKGAERMRELGLLMAGKTGPHGANQYMLSA
ncbi:hypothetical protein B2J93_7319 [Marssonina coronariae]|uniref:Uncharacterized protein n=1 Tax=Diplocarpon coronariae TaxID=2795749 RepID=A0A218Z5D5_9HELO|nr:hypothetical protein B2J93_7319 [Marssonina coronariae]